VKQFIVLLIVVIRSWGAVVVFYLFHGVAIWAGPFGSLASCPQFAGLGRALYILGMHHQSQVIGQHSREPAGTLRI